MQDGRKKEDFAKFCRQMYLASLRSWVMKPLISTPGMKEGPMNEEQVLRGLPSFSIDDFVNTPSRNETCLNFDAGRNV